MKLSQSLMVVILLTVHSFALGQYRIFPKLESEDNGPPKIEFRIAEMTFSDGLVGAYINGGEQQVYLHQEVIATQSDVVQASMIENASGGFAIDVQFTDPGAEKLREATATNSGKHFVMLVDGVAFFAPVIRDAISSPARISGNFSKDEATRIANALSPKKLRVFMLQLKPDWSAVAKPEELGTQLRQALDGAVVPESLLKGLPGTGPEILFPLEMASIFTPRKFSKLLQWLSANGLIIGELDFSVQSITTQPASAGVDEFGIKAVPLHSVKTATISRPGTFLGLSRDVVPLNYKRTAVPFVTTRPAITWTITETNAESKIARYRLSRSIVVMEEKRGQPPQNVGVLDEMTVTFSGHRDHITVMHAFPDDKEAMHRAGARSNGVLPMIVLIPDVKLVSEPPGPAAVSPPDIVETLDTRYLSMQKLWSDDKEPAIGSNARFTKAYRLSKVSSVSIVELLTEVFGPEMHVAADERTNTVIASGVQSIMEQAEALIKRLDGPGLHVSMSGRIQALVAASQMRPGDELTAANTTFVFVESASCPEGVVTNVDQISDRAIKTARSPGDWIRVEHLSEKGKKGAAVTIPLGMRVTTIPVDVTTHHNGLLQPGCRIDLILTYREQSADKTVQTTEKVEVVLENIEVFAVDNWTEGRPAAPRNVSLLVTPAQATTLLLARQRGAISTSLRSERDTRSFSVIGAAKDYPFADEFASDLIADFRKKFEAAERNAQRLAAELKGEPDFDPPISVKELSRMERTVQTRVLELSQAVSEAFRLRQRLHTLEIADGIRKLELAQTAVKTRSLNEKKIVDHRIVELLKATARNKREKPSADTDHGSRQSKPAMPFTQDRTDGNKKSEPDGKAQGTDLFGVPSG